jgi:hypothetical protein
MKFELTSGQIGPNPVWLFNNRPVSLEINQDLVAIQDHIAEIHGICRLIYKEWVNGSDWSDGYSYKLMERIEEVVLEIEAGEGK